MLSNVEICFFQILQVLVALVLTQLGVGAHDGVVADNVRDDRDFTVFVEHGVQQVLRSQAVAHMTVGTEDRVETPNVGFGYDLVVLVVGIGIVRGRHFHHEF